MPETSGVLPSKAPAAVACVTASFGSPFSKRHQATVFAGKIVARDAAAREHAAMAMRRIDIVSGLECGMGLAAGS